MTLNREQPTLNASWIDPHALGIVRALQRAGHTTYLVGGCVRDLLLGVAPKDFDIATSARPEEVRRLIHRAFIIGKRFKLVLVRRDDQQFEVATFRKDPKPDETPETPLIGDNLFGSPKEDAFRRDFTINSLFYDPVAECLVDYAHGQRDLASRLVRVIGDPDLRLREDPIRILRALRLAHMIGFQLDPDLRAGMQRHASALALSALPRRREEFLKLMRLKNPSLAFLEAWDLRIIQEISPTLRSTFEDSTKAEIFLTHLRHVHDFAVNKQDPIELFALLILAYVRAEIQPDVLMPMKSSAWLEHPLLSKLMRDELGIFKHEQALIAKALHMQANLLRTEEFQRRGERRQMAILRNEAFSLALTIAQRDYVLSPKDWLYWHERLETSRAALAELGDHSRRRRRHRRRKNIVESAIEAGMSPAKVESGQV